MSSDQPTSDAQPPVRIPSERPGKVGGKRYENRLRRTRELGDAGLTLFLEKGVETVTIDDIVARAGVAKGSFYRYFESKEQMVEWLFEPLGSKMRTAFENCAKALSRANDSASLLAAYQGMAGEFVQLLFLDRDLVRLYLQECRSPAVGARKTIRDLADEVANWSIKLTRVAIEHKLLIDVGAPVSALAVVGATERLLFGFLIEERFDDPVKIPAALITMVLDGMRPENNP